MKKWMALPLFICMVCFLASCGGRENERVSDSRRQHSPSQNSYSRSSQIPGSRTKTAKVKIPCRRPVPTAES